MAYDPKCFELATYYLPNYLPTHPSVEELAQNIQDCIEDWLHYKENERERNEKPQGDVREVG